jgi:hypothetical protein
MASARPSLRQSKAIRPPNRLNSTGSHCREKTGQKSRPLSRRSSKQKKKLRPDGRNALAFGLFKFPFSSDQKGGDKSNSRLTRKRPTFSVQVVQTGTGRSFVVASPSVLFSGDEQKGCVPASEALPATTVGLEREDRSKRFSPL